MSTIEELKKMWGANPETTQAYKPYDHKTLENIIKSRTKKNMKKSMHYFWGAFFLQILVYALLSHVILKYGADTTTLFAGIAGMLLYLPFTILLMKKFKQMAILKPAQGNSGRTLFQYILQQRALLQSFYTFKKRYELLLIPLSTGIGVFLTFKLFVPGGIEENPTGAIITFLITVAGMVASIRLENKKSFEQPLNDLNRLLDEFQAEE
ncbi:MAG TPA: hypothetical protein VFG46_12860 [Chryseolinea sp.]|nr:hypothetical protein [Chryseolinea sp.]